MCNFFLSMPFSMCGVGNLCLVTFVLVSLYSVLLVLFWRVSTAQPSQSDSLASFGTPLRRGKSQPVIP